VVQRIPNKQLYLVKSNQKSAADALRTASCQITEEIQKTIQRDPALRRRYEALVKGQEKERSSFAAGGRSPQAVSARLDSHKSARQLLGGIFGKKADKLKVDIPYRLRCYPK
jgi:hypothetical protein